MKTMLDLDNQTPSKVEDVMIQLSEEAREQKAQPSFTNLILMVWRRTVDCWIVVRMAQRRQKPLRLKQFNASYGARLHLAQTSSKGKSTTK